MKILVTGGAGYIGSHTLVALLNFGHEVVVLDNLSTGFRDSVHPEAQFIQGDIRDELRLVDIMRREKIQAVVHFAAKLNVRESIFSPLEYYENNTFGTLSLLKAMKQTNVKLMVYSSTGSLYGDSVQDRGILEEDPKAPLNPYAQSKLMGEHFLENLAQLDEIRFCTLRYFNAAGAATDRSNGQRTAKPYHLVHMGVRAALGLQKNMPIFGTDYPTQDGSCIRDFIHVEDLADIHALALQSLIQGAPSNTYNCGYGVGYSVREVIETIKKVSGSDFEVTELERRPGDAVSLIADASKLKRQLGWSPKRNNLQQICYDAYEWEKKMTLKFGIEAE